MTMSLSHTKTVPEVGISKLLIHLITVVFPAPLGPINPTIYPINTSKDTSLTA